jgi:hypothetical protein
MATIHPTPMTLGSTSPVRHATLAVTRWVLAIVGSVGAFLGAFILLAGDDQWIGLGGEASWRVGDIDPLWGWALLVGGAVFLIGGIALIVRDRAMATAGTRPNASPGVDLAAHAVIFTLVNALLWVQNVLITGTVSYVLLVTIPWAIGLAIQAVAYVTGRRT